MKIYIDGTVAHLQGDLTYAGMTRTNIELMVAALSRIESESWDKIRINCEKVHTVDNNGLQLLGVWMQCVRFMGVEPELYNIPDNLQQAIQMM